jgi:hypothetical protein
MAAANIPQSASDASDDDLCETARAFQLSDIEDARLEKLARALLEKLKREFGDNRSLEALTALVGHLLSRILAADNACCVAEMLNWTLRSAHADGEIDVWQLVIADDEEPGTEATNEPPARVH